MEQKIPIDDLIQGIESMLSPQLCGRFTTGEIKVLRNVIVVLEVSKKLPDRIKKERVIWVVIELMKIFLNHDVISKVEHFIR
jgi:hypothetical protein